MNRDKERRFIMSDGAARAEADYERDTDFCPHGWWGKHKFEARYDIGPADLSIFKSIEGGGAGRFIERLRSKTYVRDICVKCGKTIER